MVGIGSPPLCGLTAIRDRRPLTHLQCTQHHADCIVIDSLLSLDIVPVFSRITAHTQRNIALPIHRFDAPNRDFDAHPKDGNVHLHPDVW